MFYSIDREINTDKSPLNQSILKIIRYFYLLAITFGITAIFWGCHDGTPTKTVEESPNVVEVNVSSSGTSFTSSDDKLKVSIPPNAIEGEGTLQIKKISPSEESNNKSGPKIAQEGHSYDISLKGTKLVSCQA